MNRVTHFHDQELIAHLNDAASQWQRRRIQRHLASCLECRYRLNRLDDELRGIVAFAGVLRQTDLPSIERAKRLFRNRIALENSEPVRRRIPRAPVLIWAAAAVAALLLSAVWLLLPSRVPADALAQARSIEDKSFSRSGVRQEFELTWSRPHSAPSPPRRIEVIYDPRGKRFSLSWRNPDGSLAYGLWRPSAERVMEYYPAESDSVRPLHPGRATGASVNTDVERTLVTWLEGRDAAPIRLSREGILTPSLISLGQPGSTRDGRDLLMLQWRTSAMKDKSLLTLSLNLTNYRPVSQSLKCEAAGVDVELTLLEETPVPLDRMDSTVFEPSPLLIMTQGFRGVGDPVTLDFLAFLFRAPFGEYL